MAVGRDTLYIYGGMMEVKDRLITLDDLYTLNLSKLDEWKCLIPATQTEWIEVSEEEDDDDEDEYEDDSEDEELGSGDDSDDSEDDEDAGNSGSRSIEVGDVVAILKGENKKLRRKEKRAWIEQIRASLGLFDSQRTPTPGESLKDFYKRTNMYWQMAAYEHTQHTGKLEEFQKKHMRAVYGLSFSATDHNFPVSFSSLSFSATEIADNQDVGNGRSSLPLGVHVFST